MEEYFNTSNLVVICAEMFMSAQLQRFIRARVTRDQSLISASCLGFKILNVPLVTRCNNMSFQLRQLCKSYSST